MNELISVIVIIVLLLVIFLYYEKKYSELTFVKSSVDNKKYLVRNRKDRMEGANLLANLNTKIQEIIQFSKKEKIFMRLIKKYDPENISESLSSSRYTSYSVNKGDKIVFCIRSKDKKQELIDINTLTFVAIHELAHIESKSIGHTKEFWDNMRELLKIAIELGVYKETDYKTMPVKYCGIDITSSPL